jgi:hypothetical protein
MTAYTKVALKREESQTKTLFLAKDEFFIDFLCFHCRGIDEPASEERTSPGWVILKQPVTYFNLAFALIILLKFSFVTSSSSSSRRAKSEEGWVICRFATSCFTTSATIKVGSIRTLTTPSFVVTLFVGMAGLEEVPLEVGTRARRASPFDCEDMTWNISKLGSCGKLFN